MTRLDETWTHADDASLTADLTWTETQTGGSLSIVSNKAHLAGGASAVCSARAESDVSTSDQICTVDCTWQSSTARMGGCVRFSASASTYYLGSGSAFSDVDEINKVVAGTRTQLASQADTIGAESKIVTTTADGSSISVKVGAASTLSVTDTSITGGTRGGIAGSSNTGASTDGDWDNWSLNDVRTALDGTTTADFGASAALSRAVPLATTTDATFGVSGSISVARALVGSTTADFGDSVAMVVARALAGSTTADFGAPGVLGVTVPFAATTDATFGDTATLTFEKALAGTTTADFVAAAAAAAARGLAGTTIAEFGDSAVVAIARALAAAATVEFGDSAALAVARALVGTGAATFDVAATIGLARLLAGTAIADFATTVDLIVTGGGAPLTVNASSTPTISVGSAASTPAVF